MPIIARNTSDGQNYEPAPIGVHQAVCVDVIDLGMLKVTYEGKTSEKHKITLAWQLEDHREDGKPYLVHKRYTLSLHERASLRKDLDSWRGRAFTPEELSGFDVENVLGANCLLNIVHNAVADRTYANVTAIMPLARAMQKIVGRDYVRKKDRQPEQEQPHEPEQTPITADDIVPF